MQQLFTIKSAQLRHRFSQKCNQYKSQTLLEVVVLRSNNKNIKTDLWGNKPATNEFRDKMQNFTGSAECHRSKEHRINSHKFPGYVEKVK